MDRPGPLRRALRVGWSSPGARQAQDRPCEQQPEHARRRMERAPKPGPKGGKARLRASQGFGRAAGGDACGGGTAARAPLATRRRACRAEPSPRSRVPWAAARTLGPARGRPAGAWRRPATARRHRAGCPLGGRTGAPLRACRPDSPGSVTVPADPEHSSGTARCSCPDQTEANADHFVRRVGQRERGIAR